ncbi:MAG: YdeI/OmpD-associated family protein [Gemmatimonadaceae bacterium]
MAKAFRTQKDFRAWLEKNHTKVKELNLRLFKVHAKERGIGYKEALDEALCYGWIDGVRRSLDADSFTQRFTPRKARSNWSAVNIKRAKELIEEKRMRPPGLAAFEARAATAVAPYSFENRHITLDPAFEKKLRANKKAWEFFQSQAPWYRRTVAFWVMQAKREDTRARRFETLYERCAGGKPIPLLARTK